MSNVIRMNNQMLFGDAAARYWDEVINDIAGLLTELNKVNAVPKKYVQYIGNTNKIEAAILNSELSLTDMMTECLDAFKALRGKKQ